KKIYTLAAAAFCAYSLSAAAPQKSVVNYVNTDLEKKLEVKVPVKQANTRADEPAWESIGEGTLRDGLIAGFLKVDVQDIPVTFEQDKNNPTHYRIVNPYENWINPFSDLEYDDSGTFYLYFNLEEYNGKKVWYIPEITDLGIIFPELAAGVQGMASLMTYGDMIGAVDSQGEIITMDDFVGNFTENALGQVDAQGRMTYPYNMTQVKTGKEFPNLMLHLSSMDEGYGYPVNKKGFFTIFMPGVEVKEYDPFEGLNLVGECKMQNNILDNIFGESSTPEGTVTVYEEPDRKGYFHIKDAFLAGDWNTAEQAATFDFQINLTNPDLGIIERTDTQYVEDVDGLGQTEILSISEYELYYSQTPLTPEQFLKEYLPENPNENIYIDSANKRIIIEYGSILYLFSNSNQLYQATQGTNSWIQLPANYVLPVSGVNSVVADDVNAPAKYFNLQGMEIANPEAGQLVIVKKGNKATKVIVK
ncbi:MAG: hypothetical protein K2L89_00610, partial [Muribaculaceae bacterium]|nr:hypothetical protein [Muribaculaceae bacterium]